jgi:hypothetical protein
MVVYGALDIGGTKIAGALVDTRGRPVVRAQRATPARESAEVLMGAVTAVLDELASHAAWEALACMGVASAGPVDTVAGTVSPVNIPGWRDFPLVERVGGHPRMPAGIQPVLVGDAVAMTAAEHCSLTHEILARPISREQRGNPPMAPVTNTSRARPSVLSHAINSPRSPRTSRPDEPVRRRYTAPRPLCPSGGGPWSRLVSRISRPEAAARAGRHGQKRFSARRGRILVRRAARCVRRRRTCVPA